MNSLARLRRRTQVFYGCYLPIAPQTTFRQLRLWGTRRDQKDNNLSHSTAKDKQEEGGSQWKTFVTPILSTLVVVSTLGVLYREDLASLRKTYWGRPIDGIDNSHYLPVFVDGQVDEERADTAKEAEKAVENHAEGEEEECYQSLGEESGIMIFSGSASVELAREVCAHLNISLSRVNVAHSSAGEVQVNILDDVRSRDVYVFQSVSTPCENKTLHAQLMELFLTISALRRASSERITAVIPYLGYSRQSEVDQVRPKPMGVADISNILYTMGVDRVIFVDHHAPRAAAFFPHMAPVTNIMPHKLAIRYLTKKALKDPVVIASVNTGGGERAKEFWVRLKRHFADATLATVVSNRPFSSGRTDDEVVSTLEDKIEPFKKDRDESAFSTGEAKTFFIGEVRNRDCVIVDNIIDSGTRVSAVANACRASGARRIFVYVTHGLLSEGAMTRLDNCAAEEILLTNSIELPKNSRSDKIKVLNISRLVAEVVRRLHAETSAEYNDDKGIADLYRDRDFDLLQSSESRS